MREREIPRVPEPAAQAPARVVPENPTDRVTSISVSQTRSTRERFTPPAVTGGQPGAAASLPERPSAREKVNGDEAAAQDGVSALEPSFKHAVRVGGSQASSDRARNDVSKPAPRPERAQIAGSLDASLRAIERPRPVARPELASDTSPLPVEEVNRLFAASLEAPRAQPPRPRPPVETARGYGAAAEPARNPVADDAHIHVDIVGMPTVGMPERFAPDVAESKPLAAWPIDEKSWSRGIPRCCDTCREFQRNPDGKTGVCGSKYAFTRRTVVECDELACRSSVGVWWLPSDDIWLDRAEIAHHTRPTPYLDAILAELQSETR